MDASCSRQNWCVAGVRHRQVLLLLQVGATIDKGSFGSAPSFLVSIAGEVNVGHGVLIGVCLMAGEWGLDGKYGGCTGLLTSEEDMVSGEEKFFL